MTYSRVSYFQTSTVLPVPERSRLAWEQLLASYPEGQALPDAGDWTQNLQIAALPEGARIANLPDDEWVLRYQQVLETLGKKQKKQGQSQSGVFFTPVPVAAYLTRRSLGQYLDQVYLRIQQVLAAKNRAEAALLMESVCQLKIIDPACGTGVFLVEALKLLSEFYRKIQAFDSPFFTESATHLVGGNQLYGIDLDPLSVMITECRLTQWTRRLESLDAAFKVKSHIVCADTLGPENPFVTQYWDFILGNPPYISEVRKQAERFQPLQNQSGYYQAKMDLCDAFLAWSLNHLRPMGQIVYVLPEYWTQRSSTESLRQRLWREGDIREFWTFQSNRLFKNAPGHHSSFLIWQKHQAEAVHNVHRSALLGNGTTESDLQDRTLTPVTFTLQPSTGKIVYGLPTEMALLDQLADLSPLLQKSQIQQGVVIPQGRLKKQDRACLLTAHPNEIISENAGIFLLDDAEILTLNFNAAERQLLKPYYLPAGFQPFQGFQKSKPDFYLIYGNAENRKAIEKNPLQYPTLRQHLDRFREILTSDFAPYGLHRARQPIWFEDANKILCPRQVMRPACAVIPETAYVNESFFSIRTEEDPFYVCALLNSAVGWYWLYQQKRKGHQLQIDKEVLLKFPKPLEVAEANREQLIALARELSVPQLENPLFDKHWKSLNGLVYEAYQLSDESIEFLARFIHSAA